VGAISITPYAAIDIDTVATLDRLNTI